MDVRVIHELLRRANRGISLDIYAQAMSLEKRKVQMRVVKIVFEDSREGRTSYRTLNDPSFSGQVP